MEQREEIKMKEATIYNLTDEELRRFYTIFALVHYTNLRKPDYNQKSALARLSADLKQLTTLASQLAEQEPNSLSMYRFRRFFERHYKLLLEVTKNR
ncbi:MAG: hypothetical protein R3Y22_02930 [Bacteroidales bacterium]